MPRELIAGEHLLLPPVRHHWILLVRKLGWPVAGTALFLAVVDSMARGLLPADVRALCTAAVLAGVGLWTIVAWLRWTEDSLTVTDLRVILEEGVIRRSSTAIPLDRVQDVSTTQTLLGRLLGYGCVEIDAAGSAGCERFSHVGSPERLRDLVFLRTAIQGAAPLRKGV